VIVLDTHIWIWWVHGDDRLRNDLNTPLCHSELVYSVSRLCLVSESPIDGKRPDEILKQVQDDTFLYVLRSFLMPKQAEVIKANEAESAR